MNSNNYFTYLTRKARQLDDGIEKLSVIWEMPENLTGGYHAVTVDTENCVKNMWGRINKLQDEIENFQSSNKNLNKSVEDSDELLKDCEDQYEEISKQVNDLETVLSEYGYSYEDKNLNNEQSVNGNQLNSLDRLEESLVVFTPDLSWRKMKHSNGSTSLKNELSNVPKAIATPVIKSIGSVRRLKIFDEPNQDS